MWGARKKREAEDDDQDIVPKLQNKRRSSSRIADIQTVLQSERVSKTDSSNSNEFDASSVSKNLEVLLQYMDTFEGFIQTDEFDQMINQETISIMFEAMKEYMPGESMPDLTSLDVSAFRILARQGVSTLKQSVREFMGIIDDPDQVNAVISNLPVEAQPIARAMLQGDISPLSEMIEKSQHLTAEQKVMVSSLLEGRMDVLAEQVKSTMQTNIDGLLSSDAQIESMRQYFLTNPELLAAYGVSEDMLSDKEKWKDLMSEGLAGMMGLMNSQQEGRVEARGRKDQRSDTFARGRRAA